MAVWSGKNCTTKHRGTRKTLRFFLQEHFSNIIMLLLTDNTGKATPVKLVYNRLAALCKINQTADSFSLAQHQAVKCHLQIQSQWWVAKKQTNEIWSSDQKKTGRNLCLGQCCSRFLVVGQKRQPTYRHCRSCVSLAIVLSQKSKSV